jgi:hypothetical protein
MNNLIPVWLAMLVFVLLLIVILLARHLYVTSVWYIRNINCNAYDCDNCPIEDECQEVFKDADE